MAKHSTFISYYHKEDQYYKNMFDQLFQNICINKSVMDGDIRTDLSTEYIKRLIRQDYISGSSVVVVLIGKHTYTRKHVDWEIAAGIGCYARGCTGLVGILLPTYPIYQQNHYNPDTIPARLNDNVDSGYAKIYRWTEDTDKMKIYIDKAFENRIYLKNKIDNSRRHFNNNRSIPVEVYRGN